MKATISKHGQLCIESENDIEEYALRKWVDENIKQFGQEGERDFIIKENTIWFNLCLDLNN